jgi:hypothetical protein
MCSDSVSLRADFHRSIDLGIDHGLVPDGFSVVSGGRGAEHCDDIPPKFEGLNRMGEEPSIAMS